MILAVLVPRGVRQWRTVSGSSMNSKDSTHRAPTESDVAQAAGVSQSAVSRAFTPGASIAVATRAKILAAAEDLGYQPNLMARSLATRRSNIVALSIAYLENPFYAQVVKVLSDRLRETGRHILLFTTATEGQIDPAIEQVLSYQVDSVIMTATLASPELAAQCRKSGVPIVQINRSSKLAGVSTVFGENYRAGRIVGAFLAAGQHKRFGFIGGAESSHTSRQRLDGFHDALAEAGLHELENAHGHNNFEGAAAATRKFLSMKTRPDALFCASDYMAFAALDVARREFGLNVPEQLSVVGFDDVPEASHAAYDLTTFSQPAATLVEEAISIIDGMRGQSPPRAKHVQVEGKLVVRGSARIPDPR